MVNHTAFRRELEKYLDEKRQQGLKRRTLTEYRRINLNMERLLGEAGMETHPMRIGPQEINYLKAQFPPNGGNITNQRYNIETLMSFLRWCQNPHIARMRLRWPRGVRFKADWLNEQAMDVIRDAIAPDPELSMIFHMEGEMALRRCEVLRLTVEDFDAEVVHVMGKGMGEGKPRDLLKHPDTDHYLADYMDYRQTLIRKALRENPYMAVPDGLMLYYHPYQKRLEVLKKGAIDKRLHRMRKASGLYFGHHTLRRTCAREWWKAGAPIETISEMLGHEDLKTTTQYLGIKAEDQADVYRLRQERQKTLRNQLAMSKTPEFGLEIEMTGPE